MRMGVYAVRDRLAMAYIGGLQLFPHDAVAVRMFGDVAAQPDSVIGAHVEDHELHCLGYFEHETGLEEILNPGRVVITGEAWRASTTRAPDVPKVA
ncbi:MAG: nonstructural protein [Microviridae sp.]|nr:MAG: nonstructural protein [Microviridae sp.]